MKIKNIFHFFKPQLGVIGLFLFLSSCWAPRCPLVGCRVGNQEHRHSELGGVYGGKRYIPTKFHYLWDKEKSKGESLNKKDAPDGKKKKKYRRLMPWEKG